MKRSFLLAAFLSQTLAAMAQGSLEVIPLRHRSAEQVIPVLRPLMDPGGVLSGQGYQLIVRTSPRNLTDIRSALAAIDTPQRRLVISVRFDASAETAGRAIDAQGSLRAGGLSLDNRQFSNEGSQAAGRSRVEVRVLSSRSAADERVDQRVQVLEGGRAFISTGESRPLSQRQVFTGPGGTMVQDTTRMQDADTGFAVVPRLSGDTVFLEINPQRETFDTTRPGASDAALVRSQRVASSVSARLGEWIELGGALEAGSRDAGGILSSRDARTSESRRIWVQVEELRP